MKDFVRFIATLGDALPQLFASPASEMFKRLREHHPAPDDGERAAARWMLALTLARDGQAEPVKRAVQLIPEGAMKADLRSFEPHETAALAVAAWVMSRGRGPGGCSSIRDHAVADAFGIPGAAVGGSNIPVIVAQRTAPFAFRVGLADLLGAAEAATG